MDRYIILRADNFDELTEKVNSLLNQCYEPLGGVFVMEMPRSFQYIQTMYKKTADNKTLLKS